MAVGKSMVEMAQEVLNIHFSFPFHLNHPDKTCIDEFSMYAFDQTWPNTGCGFDAGMTGQAFTSGRVYVFLPECVEDEDIHVFFGGKWAYRVPYENHKSIVDDILHRNVAGVSRARGKYGAITK